MRSSVWSALFECKRRQTQVTGFGERDRGFHCVGVANLTDHDDVRRFTHRVAQRFVIRVRVQAHFTLIDDRFLVAVQVFDRIFNRKNVTGRIRVAMIEHGRERGRLTRACRADHQNQAARFHDQIAENRRQLQLLDAGDLALDRADHHAHFTALFENVDTETAGFLHRQRHVQFQIALELRNLALVHERIGDLFHHAAGQPGVAEWVQLALDLDVHRGAGRQKHVRRALIHHQFEEVTDIHRKDPKFLHIAFKDCARSQYAVILGEE
jgi:hypothetical protein